MTSQPKSESDSNSASECFSTRSPYPNSELQHPSHSKSYVVAAGQKVRLAGLDGLRGVAVVLVMCFHLWPGVMSGGWLGVGMFFTLSGYLITGIIDDEVRSIGRLRVGHFLARRVYRLMPAALFTIFVSLVLAALLQPHIIHEASDDALAAVFNVFNWRTANVEDGYARIFLDAAAPLEHFWSLAIEEQFYLLVPAAVALTRKPVAVTAAITAVGFLGLVLWWGSSDAYVATPVRSLEIAAGAWLALAYRRSPVARRLLEWKWVSYQSVIVIVVVLPVVVICGLAVTRLAHDDPVVFQGVPQLLSLCWVVLLASSLPGGPLEQVMSSGVLRWLGTRSYGIYLFHWPIIEFTDWNPWVIIAVSLAIAEVSYQLLEMPVRRLPVNRKTIAVLAVSAALTTITALRMPAHVMSTHKDMVKSCGIEYPDWYIEREDPSFFFRPGWFPCRVGSIEESLAFFLQPKNVPVVTVVGESTGQNIAYGLRLWADRTRKMAVVDRTRGACTPLATETTSWNRKNLLENLSGHRYVSGGTSRVSKDSNPGGTRSEVGPDEMESDIGPDEMESDIGPDEMEGDGQRCRVNLIEPGSSIVLVIDHAFPVVDHRHSDGSLGSILDADLVADLRGVYLDLIEQAQEVGAKVVFTTTPGILPSAPIASSEAEKTYMPLRIHAYNNLVQSITVDIESSTYAEFAPLLLDIAAPLRAYVPALRSDGVHVDIQKSEAFATTTLGPALLSLIDSISD